MNENNNDQLKNALIDVRRGYRLLHAYQTRVLDMVRYVEKRMGLSFRTGWPWYTDNYQRDTKAALDNWAFDWMYMYLYEFNLLEDRHKSGVAFSLVVVGDTGFFDSGIGWQNRNQVNSFRPAEESDTKLLFMAGKYIWHPGAENMIDKFQKSFKEKVEKTDKGVLIFKSFSFADLGNPVQADECIQEFVKYCKDNGITELNYLP